MDLGWCTSRNTHRCLNSSGLEPLSGLRETAFLAIQILLEALVHGFVRMQQLALMVFDEGTVKLLLLIIVLWLIIHSAHSCIGDHPSSRILRDFYHQTKTEERPAILGLTASPVVNSKVGKLE